MKYAYAGFGMIAVGLLGFWIIAIFQSVTVNNESEYYVLKEAMEAAMLESIDLDCYRSSEMEGCGGVIKISEQKFVENFTRRFSASIAGDVSQYEIQFYDIIENPAKASVVIKGKTKNYELMTQNGDGSFDIVNSLSGILEHDVLYSYQTRDDVQDLPLEPLAPDVDSYVTIEGDLNEERIEIQDMCSEEYPCLEDNSEAELEDEVEWSELPPE